MQKLLCNCNKFPHYEVFLFLKLGNTMHSSVNITLNFSGKLQISILLFYIQIMCSNSTLRDI